MALTIDALKGLFKKLGGSDSSFAGVNTIPEAIDKVTSVASSGGGGSDLPEPGPVGNVLTSTGTAWGSADPLYIINMSQDNHPTHDGDSVEIVEIIAAYNSGKNCILIYDGGMYRLASVEADMVVFTASAVTGEELTDYMAYTWIGVNDAGDEWFKFGYTIPLPTASNNGQILGVDNGAYALVSPAAINDYVVHFTVTVDPDTQQPTISTDNKSVAEIYAAIAAGKNVYAELDVTMNGVDVTQRFYPTMYAETTVAFGANLVDFDGAPAVDPYVIMGVHSGNMDTWSPVTT